MKMLVRIFTLLFFYALRQICLHKHLRDNAASALVLTCHNSPNFTSIKLMYKLCRGSFIHLNLTNIFSLNLVQTMTGQCLYIKRIYLRLILKHCCSNSSSHNKNLNMHLVVSQTNYDKFIWRNLSDYFVGEHPA